MINRLMFHLLNSHLFGALMMIGFFASSLSPFVAPVASFWGTWGYILAGLVLLGLTLFRLQLLVRGRKKAFLLSLVLHLFLELFFVDSYFLVLDSMGGLLGVYGLLYGVELLLAPFLSKHRSYGAVGQRAWIKGDVAWASLFFYPLFFAFLSYSSLDSRYWVNGFYIPLCLFGLGFFLMAILAAWKEWAWAYYLTWLGGFSFLIPVFVYGLLGGWLRWAMAFFLVLAYGAHCRRSLVERPQEKPGVQEPRKEA